MKCTMSMKKAEGAGFRIQHSGKLGNCFRKQLPHLTVPPALFSRFGFLYSLSALHLFLKNKFQPAWLCSGLSLQSWSAFSSGSVVRHLPADAGETRDTGSIPGSERSPGGENRIPLQYSFLENPMDRGAWRATVHGVRKSWTPVSK